MFPVIRNAPGGKGGRCVWLTTYHHYSAVVTKTRSLNSPGPLRAHMACSGTTLPLLAYLIHGAESYLKKIFFLNNLVRITFFLVKITVRNLMCVGYDCLCKGTRIFL